MIFWPDGWISKNLSGGKRRSFHPDCFQLGIQIIDPFHSLNIVCLSQVPSCGQQIRMVEYEHRNDFNIRPSAARKRLLFAVVLWKIWGIRIIQKMCLSGFYSVSTLISSKSETGFPDSWYLEGLERWNSQFLSRERERCQILNSELNFSLFSRVEPRCSDYRRRWQFHRFPGWLQSDYHTFLPLVPSSNRTSGFPRYGSPTTFPMSLSVTVVVELQWLTELV